MKKRRLIYAGVALSICLLVTLYLLLRKEKPEYITLEIPMPQDFPRYADENAESEEFSTFVSNDGFGQHHHYFIYRMYVPVYLGEQGFETEKDVENYYDEWLKKSGWEEQTYWACNSDMREFQPNESYRAYVNPTINHGRAVVCLVSWSESGDGDDLTVLIKTINPSKWEDWD